jgi:hypothetical protein
MKENHMILYGFFMDARESPFILVMVEQLISNRKPIFF